MRCKCLLFFIIIYNRGVELQVSGGCTYYFNFFIICLVEKKAGVRDNEGSS